MIATVRLLIIWLLFNKIILGSGLSQSNYLTNFHPDSLRLKVIETIRCSDPPIIDGLLNDVAWEFCIPTTEYFQIEPKELAAPSEYNSARVTYDDDKLYIFLEAYDSQPKKIKKKLVRRDSWMDGFSNNSDWLGITIDSKNDDYNGYFVAVNASGAKMDVALAGNNEYDPTWDAVWDVAINFKDNGWAAEFALPFAIFQFEHKDNMEWGISFERFIHRLQETVEWPGKSKSTRGIIRPLGVLKGLENIPDPKQLELMPYSLLGYSKIFKSNFGLDLRYGLTSNAIMKITVNPDFGQVEADPSVLNLTAFETFYEEKRPFFSEGSEFFSQRLSLFNSRRIGRKPIYNMPDEGEIKNISDYTTIIGATKIMGSTASGINYGLIGAVTAEETGLQNDDFDSTTIIIEPRTNYSIGRFEFPVINNISRVGIMATDVSRKNNPGASVIGTDWSLGFLDNRLFTNGQIVRSNANNALGKAFRFNLGYQDPVWWSTRFWFGIYDNKFDINDLGYIRRNDLSWAGIRFEFRQQEPWGRFISNNLEFKYSQDWNGEGLSLEREVEIEQDNLFANYWRVGFFSKVFLPAYNDEDIFRDENAWIYKTELWGYAGPSLSTDRRKKIVFGANIGTGYGKNRGRGYNYSLWSKIKPIEPLNIEIDAMQDKSPNYMQWVDILVDSLEIEHDTVRVYANSILITRDITLRLDWTFSPELTFQCFIQPFYAEMNYKNFYRLTEPKTMNLENYNYQDYENYENPDFKLSNTVGTFVFRWEYRSGSLLYFVYNLNQRREYLPYANKWVTEKENAIYFKINYWLKY